MKASIFHQWFQPLMLGEFAFCRTYGTVNHITFSMGYTHRFNLACLQHFFVRSGFKNYMSTYLDLLPSKCERDFFLEIR